MLTDERKAVGAGRKEHVRQEVQPDVEVPHFGWNRILWGAESSPSCWMPNSGEWWGRQETMSRKVGQPDGTDPGRVGGIESFLEREAEMHPQIHAPWGTQRSRRRVT